MSVKEGDTSRRRLKAYKDEVKRNEILSHTNFSLGREALLALCALWGTEAMEGTVRALKKINLSQGEEKVSKMIGEKKLTFGEKLDFAILVLVEEIASLGFKPPHFSQVIKYLRSRFF